MTNIEKNPDGSYRIALPPQYEEVKLEDLYSQAEKLRSLHAEFVKLRDEEINDRNNKLHAIEKEQAVLQKKIDDIIAVYPADAVPADIGISQTK